MSKHRPMVSVDMLLAYSLAIEQEAAERYAELGDQMQVHNNHEVAELFHKLAAIEAKHVANVKAIGEGRELPRISLWDLQWDDGESPEAPSHDEVHYLMTPYHALSLALFAERRAVAFFARVAQEADDEEVRHMASQLRSEEQQHVTLMQQWLGRYPEPEAGWDEDPDPPATHE
jgi:rubrerythrin